MNLSLRRSITTWQRTVAVLSVLILSSCSSGDNQPVPVAASINNSETRSTASAGTPTGNNPVELPGEASRSQRRVFPKVIIETTLGPITVKLDAEKAPATVDNFLNNYVARGHYDGTIFHYVDAGKTVLGGGFTSDLQLKESRAQITNEADNGLSNRRGTIAMARDPEYAHSATCQFYFNVADNPAFDHTGRESAQSFGYCVFGEVVQGMETVDKIAQVDVHDHQGFTSLPKSSVVIRSIRRIQ